MASYRLTGGQIIRDGTLAAGDLAIADGVVAEAAPGARVIDATGLILAPGIVDLHGDGFERNLSPRPGVYFDLDTALMETDAQLVTNGITTAYLALTISWEPGLRSLDQGRALIAAWQRLRPHFMADIRIQLRWEIYALEAADQIEAWLSLDPAPMLAFNDHYLNLLADGREADKVAKYAARSGLSEAEFRALIARVGARADEVPGTIARLATAAKAAGVICLAHDEKSPEVRHDHRALGIDVCEFPLTRPTAEDAIAKGEHTILGAPNVLRGGSHIGAIDAAPAIADGLCTCLASDYYYPAQLRAAAKLGNGSAEALARHWAVVSTNPAAAAGMAPRGTLTAGAEADVIALRLTDAGPQTEMVFRAGNLVWSRAQRAAA
ncbi:MAG: alpha-D-ribose 1-methylphosphonate 5-triphosphate diphosphatase [Pseudomonadota bacterium]